MIKLSIDAFEAMARELGKTTETKLIQVTETRTGTCLTTPTTEVVGFLGQA